MTSFHQALDHFERLEQRLGLARWKVGGVYVWKLARLSLFRDYLKSLHLQTDAQPESRRLRRTKLQMIRDFPRPFLSANPFFHRSKGIERFVIPHSRQTQINGRFIDPLTQPAWAYQSPDTSLLLDRAGSPKDPDRNNNELSLEVVQRLAWIRRQSSPIRLTRQDNSLICEISRQLGFERLSTGLTLASQIKKHARAFVGQKSVFDKLIRQKKPTHFYFVVGYGLEALIDAAQENGVDTVEFQHGTLGRGHLAYDYKEWDRVPYFPGVMLGFGHAWFEGTHFPRHTDRVMIGNPFLERRIQSARERTVRQPKTLLVISQGSISEAISNEIMAFANARPDWQIWYRPHPGENPEDIRARFGSLSTVRVDAGSPFCEQAAAAEVAIGVYSTAVIEALLAGCRIALLDLGRSTNAFQHLAEQGKARMVTSGNELADAIEEIPHGDARDYYAEPVEDVASLIEATYAEPAQNRNSA